MSEESNVEITVHRKINLGNYNEKQYTIKISGSQEVIDKQLSEQKDKLKGYLDTLSDLIDTAHEANMLKDLKEKTKKA